MTPLAGRIRAAPMLAAVLWCVSVGAAPPKLRGEEKDTVDAGVRYTQGKKTGRVDPSPRAGGGCGCGGSDAKSAGSTAASPPPVSQPPTGAVRLRVVESGKYLHENSLPVLRDRKESTLALNDKLISTRVQPPATSTLTHFRFYPQTDGTYRIRTVGSSRYWHEKGTAAADDKLISTRVQTNDDYTRFYVEEYCDGSVRLKVKASGRHLHVDTDGDELCSTRFQPGAGDKRTRFVIEYVNLADYLPGGWAGMEIEAKWRVSTSTLNAIMADLDGGSLVVGGNVYTLNVRWGGISRKYVDDYYDGAAGELGAAGHSYRVRSRYTSSPTAAGNDLTALQAASWAFDWRKVQYKSTAVRLDAVWLRHEYGNCKILGGSPACAVTSLAAILGGDIGHEANPAVLADHPAFDFTTMTMTSQVEDYRYRVELIKNGVETFEVSLDQVLTRNADDGFTSVTTSTEAELEIIKPNYNLADIEELMAVVAHFEATYSLIDTKTSKGGVYVDNALIPGAPATCLKVPLTWAVVEKRYLNPVGVGGGR